MTIFNTIKRLYDFLRLGEDGSFMDIIHKNAKNTHTALEEILKIRADMFRLFDDIDNLKQDVINVEHKCRTMVGYVDKTTKTNEED